MNITLRVTLDDGNLNEIKTMIANECDIDVNTININVNDEVLKIDGTFYHCKHEDIDAFNHDLEHYGWFKGLLAQKIQVFETDASSDDRIQINPTTSVPYTGICYLRFKLTSEGDYFFRGSGYFLDNIYSKDPSNEYTLVLTAGHVVYDDKSFVKNMTIKPGYNGDDPTNNNPDIVPVQMGGADMLFTSTAYIANGRGNASTDYGAILIRKTDIPLSAWRWRIYEGTINTIPNPMRAAIAGYPRMVRSQLQKGNMFLSGGKVSAALDGGLSYTFPTSGGQSGSPIWSMKNEETTYPYFRAIGIHNGEGKTANHGVSTVYVESSFNRWLNPGKISDDVVNTEKNGDYFTLDNSDGWYVDVSDLMAPDDKLVTGASLYCYNNKTIGIRLICANLDGTHKVDVSNQEKNNDKRYEMTKGHNRCFYSVAASAPPGKVVIGARLFCDKTGDGKTENQYMGIEIKCANLDKSGETDWIGPADTSKYWTIDKHDDGVFDTTPMNSDINYTAVTAMSLDRPSETNARVSLKSTNNVFYPS